MAQMNKSSKDLLWQCSVLAVDKFKGITCAKLVDKVKEIIFQNFGQYSWLKLGHGGTLDENATGVLVIGTGLGCKLLPYFLHGMKQYTVRGCLGIETDTLNAHGRIVREMPYDHVTEEGILAHAQKFVGTIEQVPPKYSALKFRGRRASDWTRDGVEVPLEPRSVRCYSIRLLGFEPPHFDLEVTSGGGFYVRSLVHDLGNSLGSCAHVTELRRTRHGFLWERDSLAEHELTYDNLVLNAQNIHQKPEYQQIVRKKLRPPMKSHRTSSELWIDPT